MSLKDFVLEVIRKNPKAVSAALRIEKRLKELAEAATNGPVEPERLVTGTLQADTIVTAGGARLTGTGVTLPDSADDYTEYPSDPVLTGDWITSGGALNGPSPWGGVGFFNNPTGKRRGVVVGGESRTGDNTWEGVVLIRAGNGSESFVSSGNCFILLESENNLHGAQAFLNGKLSVKGDVAVDGKVSVQYDPTSALDLTTKQYVDAPNAVNVQTPSLAAGWTATTTVKVLKYGNGLVLCTGSVQNTSGASKANGARIFTLQSDRRPLTAQKFSCPRSDNTGTWQQDLSAPVTAQTDGDVTVTAGLPNNSILDFSVINFVAGF